MSEDKQGSKRRRRRKRNRNRRGRGKNQRNRNDNQQSGRRKRGRNRNRNRNRNQGSNKQKQSGSSGYKHKTPREKFGGREPVDVNGGDAPEGKLELVPFEIFCAYHLGITADNRYRKPRSRDVSRRFGVSVNEMHDAMKRFKLDKQSMRSHDFDLELARLDIRVAPEGIDRRELAKGLFEELLERNPELAQCHEELLADAAAEDADAVA